MRSILGKYINVYFGLPFDIGASAMYLIDIRVLNEKQTKRVEMILMESKMTRLPRVLPLQTMAVELLAVLINPLQLLQL